MEIVTTGERLRAERKRIGLSQAALAAIGEINRKTIVAYEDNTTSPNAVFLSVAGLHGIDVGYVITGRRSAPLPDQEEALLDKVRLASPYDQQTITRVIDAIIDSQKRSSVSPADNLPDEALLKRMFGTLLSTLRPGSSEDEMAEFLAIHLGSALRAMEVDKATRIDAADRPEGDTPQQRRA